MALFGNSRDVSLIRTINRELMGDIITQQASFYKYKLQETQTNIYGEAPGGKYYDGPFLFNCLITREPQNYTEGEEIVNYKRNIKFAFLRDDLRDANVFAEVGDIILYEKDYYGVENVISNQYFFGKDPDYPNNINPLNPGLEEFGNNLSVICNTYYIPRDKVSISPYKERM